MPTSTHELRKTNSYDPTAYRFRVKPKHHPPSQAKIREMALNSHEGGRVRCDWCKHTFAAYYVQLVAVPLHEPKAACRDCRKLHKLTAM